MNKLFGLVASAALVFGMFTWGLRKNKTNMNYDKLSRALRYYYDKVRCLRPGLGTHSPRPHTSKHLYQLFHFLVLI